MRRDKVQYNTVKFSRLHRSHDCLYTEISMVDDMMNSSRIVLNGETTVYKLEKNLQIHNHHNEDFLALCNVVFNSMLLVHFGGRHRKLAMAKMGLLKCPKRL